MPICRKCDTKTCAYCRKAIAGPYYSIKGKYYHQECFQNHVDKVCCVCGKPIDYGGYYIDDWGNCAHAKHGGVKTQICYSCGRLVSGSAKPIGSKAVLCGLCAPSSVNTSAQIEDCRSKVLAMFKSFGINGIPEDVPIELKRIESMRGAKGRIHCLRSLSGRSYNFQIEIVFGLPEVHFMGVLAHELLHSWLWLYGREVTDEECEGFCNLGCGYVYQKINTEHSRMLLKQMYESEDRIYGEGYRLQKMRFEKLGWAGLLDSLRRK